MIHMHRDMLITAGLLAFGLMMTLLIGGQDLILWLAGASLCAR